MIQSFCKILLISILSLVVCVQANAGSCPTPAQATGFSLIELRSRLMVSALVCQDHKSYNVFMKKFRTSVARGDNLVRKYFATEGGARAYDAYITQLANAQSNIAAQQEPDQFCAKAGPKLVYASHTRSAKDLSTLAINGAMLAPLSLLECRSD